MHLEEDLDHLAKHREHARMVDRHAALEHWQEHVHLLETLVV